MLRPDARALPFGVAALLVSPLLSVVIWMHGVDHWAPILDEALIEMRVRDVGTRDTPLVGLPGRLSRSELPAGYGSHPGPVSFYLLAPSYRLFGSTYWALRVATVLSNALAVVAALALARRRGGTWAVLAVGLALGVLELGFGLVRLTAPWNPHLPLLWFVVFLVAAWVVLCGDVAMLPVAAFAGTYCAQTHVPYVAVCGPLGLLLAAAVSLG